MCTDFWSESLKGRDDTEDLCIDERTMEWLVGK